MLQINKSDYYLELIKEIRKRASIVMRLGRSSRNSRMISFSYRLTVQADAMNAYNARCKDPAMQPEYFI